MATLQNLEYLYAVGMDGAPIQTLYVVYVDVDGTKAAERFHFRQYMKPKKNLSTASTLL